MKLKILLFTYLFILIAPHAYAQNASDKLNPGEYEVAVYHFPNYHPDSINAKWHGKGWTEWEVVKAAKPRFEGHGQPKVPTWGYFDESDPKWAAKEIDLAADHGIDCFIYDWYWYSNTGPYLQEGMGKGFLRAPNRNRLKFTIMWANHDWLNIQPAPFDNGRTALAQGEVSWNLRDTLSTYCFVHHFDISRAGFPAVPYQAAVNQYNPRHKIVVLNSWNEWTEGSYLLP